MSKPIYIKNANQINLKNICLEVPKNKITVFNGISGSGKSSVVFDMISTEAKRQLYSTFSSFIRKQATTL